jgi:hypothetical protein
VVEPGGCLWRHRDPGPSEQRSTNRDRSSREDESPGSEQKRAGLRSKRCCERTGIHARSAAGASSADRSLARHAATTRTGSTDQLAGTREERTGPRQIV